MENSLHRQLKALYCADAAQHEVQVDGYRIDAVDGDRLIEIQSSSLGAIRDKIRDLLTSHDVLVVKPLAARKYLVKRKRKRGRVTSSRYSPVRETIYHLFDDLVHFVTVFPHPRLTLEVLLVEQEEHRLPAPKRWYRSKGFRVEDRTLRSVQERRTLHDLDDVLALLPEGLPTTFSTGDLATAADIPRWLAQKMAYCLRETGGVQLVGKRGNALLYEVAETSTRAA